MFRYGNITRHARTFVCAWKSRPRRQTKSVAFAVFYDELCRKEWAERASRGDTDFDVNVVSMDKDLEILARARIAYDAASMLVVAFLCACMCTWLVLHQA